MYCLRSQQSRHAIDPNAKPLPLRRPDRAGPIQGVWSHRQPATCAGRKVPRKRIARRGYLLWKLRWSESLCSGKTSVPRTRDVVSESDYQHPNKLQRRGNALVATASLAARPVECLIDTGAVTSIREVIAPIAGVPFEPDPLEYALQKRWRQHAAQGQRKWSSTTAAHDIE